MFFLQNQGPIQAEKQQAGEELPSVTLCKTGAFIAIDTTLRQVFLQGNLAARPLGGTTATD